jgi:hypothetical protein
MGDQFSREDSPKPPEPTNVHQKLEPIEHTKLKIHAHKFIYGYIFLLIIAIIAGIGLRVWQTHHNSAIKPSSSQTLPSKVNQNILNQPSLIMTYASSTNFIVVNANNKVLTKVNINKSDNAFYVYAKNPQVLLLGETYNANEWSWPGTNQNFILVNFNGSSITLSPSVSDVITRIIGEYNGSQFLLNDSNILIYVDCSQTTQECSLDSINLTTGIIKSYITVPGGQTDGGLQTQSSINLMGIKDNVIYYYYAGESSSASQVVISYNLQSRNVLQTLPLQVPPLNPPIISSDDSEAIYTDQNNDGTRYIMNLSNGKTIVIKSNITSDNGDYLWSPNDQYVAFTAPFPGQTSATPPYSIDYIDLSTEQTMDLKNFGDPRYNGATLYIWTSDSDIYYSESQTASANDFSGTPDAYNEISIPAGNLSPNPAPDGYNFCGPPPGSAFDLGP